MFKSCFTQMWLFWLFLHNFVTSYPVFFGELYKFDPCFYSQLSFDCNHCFTLPLSAHAIFEPRIRISNSIRPESSCLIVDSRCLVLCCLLSLTLSCIQSSLMVHSLQLLTGWALCANCGHLG